MNEETRAWIQLVAAVVTAVSTTIGAGRLWVQTRQHKLEKAQAARQGVDPERAEHDGG